MPQTSQANTDASFFCTRQLGIPNTEWLPSRHTTKSFKNHIFSLKNRVVVWTRACFFSNTTASVLSLPSHNDCWTLTALWELKRFVKFIPGISWRYQNGFCNTTLEPMKHDILEDILQLVLAQSISATKSSLIKLEPLNNAADAVSSPVQTYYISGPGWEGPLATYGWFWISPNLCPLMLAAVV